MELVTWVIVGILAVDLLIVLSFATVELLARHRVQREIERLDALWRSPPTQRVPVERSVGALRVRTRPVAIAPAASPRLGAVSLTTATIAVASLVVVAVLGGTPAATRSLTVPNGASDATPLWGGTREPVDDADPGSDVDGFRQALLDHLDDLRAAPTAPSTITPHAGPVERVAAVATSPSSIVLVWDQVAAAIRYHVERSSREDGALDWTVIGETDGGVTTFMDPNVESGTTYYYRVRALIVAGPVPPSDVISATTPVPPPEATSLTVTAMSSTTISLDWVDVKNETGYRIERSLDGESDWTTIATTGTDVTEFTDGDLASKTVYRYRVFAINEGGESPPSNIGVAKTGKATAVEEPPRQDEDGASPEKGKGTGNGSGSDIDSDGDVASNDGTGSDDGEVWDDGTRSDETPSSDGTTT